MATWTRPQPQWSHRDTALWHTCEIAYDLATRERVPVGLQMATPFPLRFGAEEMCWAGGTFELLTYRAPGDGRYERRTGVFLATGGGGLAVSAAVAATRALTNSSRRRAAAALTVPRWVVDQTGTLFVTDHGFYLHTTTGVAAWPWAALETVSVVDARSAQLTARDGPAGAALPGGAVVRSDWAELLFVGWAMARHHRHPQLASGDWLPRGWLAHAAQHYPTRLRSPHLS